MAMDWDSIDSSGWDTGSAFNQGGDFSVPAFGSFDASAYDTGLSLPQITTQPTAMDEWSQLYGGAPNVQQPFSIANPATWFQGGGAGSGGSAPPGAGPNQGLFPGMGALGGLNTLPGLLGLTGGTAGLIGSLVGGGVTNTQKPVMGTAQKAAINQAGQALSPFAAGATPLQLQQAGLLNSIFQQGQVPPGLQTLVSNAYDPYTQSLVSQITDNSRAAGFYDAPLTSPVGSRELGPAMAQLRGQEAGSLLGLLQNVPSLYQPAIDAQIRAAGGQANNLLTGAHYGIGTQDTGNFPAQIGSQLGNIFQGAGTGITQQQNQQAQQQWLNNWLNLQRQQGSGGGQGGQTYAGLPGDLQTPDINLPNNGQLRLNTQPGDYPGFGA